MSMSIDPLTVLAENGVHVAWVKGMDRRLLLIRETCTVVADERLSPTYVAATVAATWSDSSRCLQRGA